MKTYIDFAYWLAFGALFLNGCTTTTNTNDTSSTGGDTGGNGNTGGMGGAVVNTSSSGSGMGGSAGNGGMGSNASSSGMGGAGGSGSGMGGSGGSGGKDMSSSSSGMGSSSSSSGMGGGGSGGMGMGGGGGSGGGGSLCPEWGGKDGCGTATCPPCPPLVMIGTGPIGVTGTFVSSSNPMWSTATYSNEASTDAPAMVTMPGQNRGMALIRRSDAVLRYRTWTPASFSAWNSIMTANGTVSTRTGVSATATASAIHVGIHGTDSKHYYARYTTAGNWVYPMMPVTMFPSMPDSTQGGAHAPAVAAPATSQLMAFSSFNRFFIHTNSMNTPTVWFQTFGNGTAIAEVPAIVTFTGQTRDVLAVFTDNSSTPNQLRWVARQGAAWSTPANITNAAATNPVLLALPNGDAVLAYRDATKKIWWTRFNGTTAIWTNPQQPPGNMLAKAKPALALGAGDAEVELLFVDDATSNGYHARYLKGSANFTTPQAIPGAKDLAGIAAATNL